MPQKRTAASGDIFSSRLDQQTHITTAFNGCVMSQHEVTCMAAGMAQHSRASNAMQVSISGATQPQPSATIGPKTRSESFTNHAAACTCTM
jgi:hypothetical protein